MQSRLYEARKKSKMTQEDLATKLGISRISYGLKERGEMPFTGDEMFEIASIFGTSIEKIFLPRSNQNGYKVG
ncbi:helix-turn-helix transcriptional regulator [Enterococcus pseudoavium]|uniref:Helix-turn-helix transcriptional regulator n=1 Tax=Enterococcus pseudoavium TaxID=44007 RepID=A0ABU3FKL1_9ENTE|nr:MULTISPECIES: helix-turn-helix transcriptional regulator [Enterococcus]MBU5366638.1 helix-turn-helix domain-containing protein [Enterococcus devriesei]MDT2771597.1 helix-turn-helix transcriptional regulator [Enterococcus pseudoavium]